MSRNPVETAKLRKLVTLLRDHDVALLPAVRDYAAAMIEDMLDNGHTALDDILFDEIDELFGRE